MHYWMDLQTRRQRRALNAAPFSDAFLAIVLVLILALAAALELRSGIKGDKESEQVQKEEAK